MKKLLAFPLLCLLLATACKHDNDQGSLSQYDDWKALNQQWLTEMQQKTNADGSPYYRTVIPVWNPGIFILYHQFNDPAETAQNLTPLYTSTVDVRYIGHDCTDAPFDSSTTVTKYGTPGVARFACNQVIQGWSIAMEQMHVGDTVEIIVPYEAGYGASLSTSLKPYSNLRFNIRLHDIYRYEASPY